MKMEDERIPLRFLHKPSPNKEKATEGNKEKKEERAKPKKLVRFLDRERSPIPSALRRL